MVNKEQYEKIKQPEIVSKSQVEKASDRIRKDVRTKYEEDISVIQKYRAMHEYSLNKFDSFIRRKVIDINNKDTVVARRLKRLPSIIDKLKRDSLSQGTKNSINVIGMQDIAGCRVILKNEEEVYLLLESLKKSKTSHEIIKIQDYIKENKPSGYSGIHVIFKTFSKTKSNIANVHQHAGYRIELQIRTKLQHAWATAVEVVDLIKHKDFAGQSLKTYISHDECELTSQVNNDLEKWVKYFALVSKFFNQHDRTTDDDLISLKILNKELNAHKLLYSFNAAFKVEEIEKAIGKNSKAVLLEIIIDSDPIRGTAKIFSDELEAEERYNIAERDESKLVLLVFSKNINELKKAYPNYLGDISEYLLKISSILL